MSWLFMDSRLPWLTVPCYSYSDDGLGPHNGSMFSTKDKDVDTATLHCAEIFKSGWWFAGCFTCNLNGHYYTDTASGIFWHGLTLKKTAMKIRPMN